MNSRPGPRSLSRPLPVHPSGIDALRSLDRRACESTVRYVFGLIWPRAGIACSWTEEGCVVDLREHGLQHRVLVPWALVEFDRGLALVRAVYRAGLPDAFERAAAGLVLAL